jgi:hypothetical protein
MEARGLVPGTSEYVAVRNKVYAELRRGKREENEKNEVR